MFQFSNEPSFGRISLDPTFQDIDLSLNFSRRPLFIIAIFMYLCMLDCLKCYESIAKFTFSIPFTTFALYTNLLIFTTSFHDTKIVLMAFGMTLVSTFDG